MKKKPQSDVDRIDTSVVVDPLRNPPSPFLEIMSDALTAKTGRLVTTDDVYERGLLDDIL
jgi:hypothetical protein